MGEFKENKGPPKGSLHSTIISHDMNTLRMLSIASQVHHDG